jgi:hypothetical protein
MLCLARHGLEVELSLSCIRAVAASSPAGGGGGGGVSHGASATETLVSAQVSRPCCDLFAGLLGDLSSSNISNGGRIAIRCYCSYLWFVQRLSCGCHSPAGGGGLSHGSSSGDEGGGGGGGSESSAGGGVSLGSSSGGGVSQGCSTGGGGGGGESHGASALRATLAWHVRRRKA